MTPNFAHWAPFPALTLAVSLAACGGTYPGAETPKSQTIDVEGSALPFKILRRGGQEIAAEALFEELATARVVCLGEIHNNPHDHWAQLHILDALTANQNGRSVALGMEMFQRPFQGVLDDYNAGKIAEDAMLSRTAWKKRWGFDWALYRPMVVLAKERGVPVLALNIRRELLEKISKQGMDALTDDERGRIPELELDDEDHRAWWDAIMASMAGHGHGGGDSDGKQDPEEAKKRADRIYRSQVLWDETMADTTAKWLVAGEGRQVIILAGNGHCHDSAMVRRIQRRGVDKVVSVHPVIDDGEGNVAELLAEPNNDYLFVMTPLAE